MRRSTIETSPLYARYIVVEGSRDILICYATSFASVVGFLFLYFLCNHPTCLQRNLCLPISIRRYVALPFTVPFDIFYIGCTWQPELVEY